MNKKLIYLFSTVAVLIFVISLFYFILNAGSYVIVSGNINFGEYKRGIIIVSGRSEYNRLKGGSPDLQIVRISGPGHYKLKLPKNYGKVFIEAVHTEREDRRPDINSPRGEYEYNPIVIGSSNIKNIDITLNPSKPFLMDTYKGPTVSISGTVSFDEYDKGPIFIIASQQDLTFRNKEAIPVAMTRIDYPGSYRLDVPQNSGEIFIEAMNLEMGNRRPVVGDARGEYPNNPIFVSSDNINNIDIRLNKGMRLLMVSYKGDAVTISGKVVFDKYEGGPITISASSKQGKVPPDINFIEIPKPQEYSITVPKNIGYVYIRATNISARERRPRFEVLRGEYVNNPIFVQSSDIKDINIVILE